MVLEIASFRHQMNGDWATAWSLSEQGLTVWRAGNVVLGVSSAVAASAAILAQLGDAENALARAREAERLLEGSVSSFHRSACHALGRACLLLGRLDQAQQFAAQSLEYSPSHRGSAAHALHLLGDIATHPARFDAERGDAYYRQALTLAEPRGMRPLVAHCHLGLGRLFQRAGKREQAQEHLITATTMYREMDMRFWLEQAEAEIKEPR